MAHSKCYGIDEDKCKVRILSMSEIEERLNSEVVAQPEPTGEKLFLTFKPGVSERIYNNKTSPKNVYIGYAVGATSPYDDGAYQSVGFRFNKSIGGGYASAFIKLPTNLPGWSLKFLNNPDITTWTRVFLTVYVDGKTIYVRADGC